MDLVKFLNSLLLGNTKLSGLRTILINTITMILVAWEFASKDGGLFSFLCQVSDTFKFLVVFCHISETHFYMVFLGILAALNNILRYLTVTPAGVPSSPAALTVAHRDPTNRQLLVEGIVILSIVSLLFFIAKAIIGF